MKHPEHINALAAVLIAIMFVLTALSIADTLAKVMTAQNEARVTITNSIVGSKPSAARVTVQRDGKVILDRETK